MIRKRPLPGTSYQHKGFSMSPLLKPGDRLIYSPCHSDLINKGDILLFREPGKGSCVVHRVIKAKPDGISTRGDSNCLGPDPWLLRNEDIIGKVVSVNRAGRLKKLSGGFPGLMFAVMLRAFKRLDVSVSRFLHPLYQWLSVAGLLLPARFLFPEIRLLRFDSSRGTEFQIIMGNRVIGRKKTGENFWRIRRPFRLIVPAQILRQVY
ncbi:hypothetical protein ACFL5V_12180 [Fibrobacterota bacterium]